MDVKQVQLDAEGFLVDYKEWNEELAKELAKEEGIEELTDRHWHVIRFMREEYEKTGQVPTIRRLKNAGGIPTKELYALFPNGPAKKAARIAGLPKPQGCV
ncbi:MAG: TusE/DsrC/DsvC family sulfur relay protein [candidate division KSB1 bacterium]|nr:TusE/DsrC/DsvC family sulfur relay protein [candidate division KSB1 bacterium]MDQ7066236.1 TusE/DsrC/DsvC family sulfur relay protein [candidate division KSB1 bacterium]